ncbi:mechanosensitive ion channel protein MscS [candidate division WOR-3 bacterium 4484_100]|uniref:Mechanosensitive ion channel protein MscS n=1 Tax=candidate division WOR-3 bacterium 4484_100 TaxID=1936077 RepID=A0A1V4QES4_UNCW3|nr:MAG: mechanosensitive ion channel protein MscS [candidate division WOR-3 bacterium 4484_100]
MNITIQHTINAFAFIIGGLVIGLVVQNIILTRLRKIALRTKWEGDEVIIDSLRGAIVFWFLLAGIYGAVMHLPLSPNLSTIIIKILVVIIILSVTFFFIRLTTGFLRLYSQKTAALPSASLLINLTKGVILVLGGLIILQSLGISITPLITALGVGGLAVALALQDTLSNLFAGFHIIVSKMVLPGDYIKLATGEEGYVTDVSWRNTTIRALPNNIVVVPNSKLASSILTNFHQPVNEMSVLVQVGVSYDSDLEKVEKVTIEVAKKVLKEVPGGIPDFEPFIRYHTFGDFSINFSVILRVKEFVDQYLIKHEFIKRLHKRYQAEGIEIPFPIHTIYMKK